MAFKTLTLGGLPNLNFQLFLSLLDVTFLAASGQTVLDVRALENTAWKEIATITVNVNKTDCQATGELNKN